ncbi:MAG: ubiquinone/menaquinone biosynthesis methyltransferase [Bradymonadia bacterium]
MSAAANQAATDQNLSGAPRDGSGEMFDRIADKYDRLNRVISLGMDRGWRKKLVRALQPDGAAVNRVLDVATGTADVALDIADAYPEAHVVGLDPSVGMLDVGHRKVAKHFADAEPRVELVVGDGQDLPFEDDHFDASCISFGIRNVPDRAKGLSEMARVTRHGGRVVVLELSEPEGAGPMALGARFHIHVTMPMLGRLLSSAHEYRYLQQSVSAFPPAPEFAEMMRDAGIEVRAVKPLAFGAAYLYVGISR